MQKRASRNPYEETRDKRRQDISCMQTSKRSRRGSLASMSPAGGHRDNDTRTAFLSRFQISTLRRTTLDNRGPILTYVVICRQRLATCRFMYVQLEAHPSWAPFFRALLLHQELCFCLLQRSFTSRLPSTAIILFQVIYTHLVTCNGSKSCGSGAEGPRSQAAQ